MKKSTLVFALAMVFSSVYAQNLSTMYIFNDNSEYIASPFTPVEVSNGTSLELGVVVNSDFSDTSNFNSRKNLLCPGYGNGSVSIGDLSCGWGFRSIAIGSGAEPSIKMAASEKEEFLNLLKKIHDALNRGEEVSPMDMRKYRSYFERINPENAIMVGYASHANALDSMALGAESYASHAHSVA